MMSRMRHTPHAQLTRTLAKAEGQLRRVRSGEIELEAARSEEPRLNDLRRRLRLEDRPLSALRPLGRRLTKADAKRVAKAVRLASHYGFVPPVIFNEDGAIIGEDLSFEVARQLELGEIPCIVVDGEITEDDVRLISVALQHQASTAEIDLDALRFHLIQLSDAGMPLDLTGYEPPQIELLMSETEAASDPALDKVPVVKPQAVSQPGDLWLLGNSHRVLCADATDPKSYLKLMDGEVAAASIGDPPFNVPIAGNVSGNGKVKHEDFVMGVGEWTEAEFEEFLTTYLRVSSEHVLEGAAVFAFMDWRSSHLLVLAGKAAGLTHKAKCIWSKGGGAMGTPWRSAFEEIVVFSNGEKFRTDNIQLGKHGRNRTNVWEYAGANRPGSSAGKALKLHSTPKSVEMIADAIKDVTAIGEIVLDPFLGSGTTIMAAEAVGRRGYGLELDPKYVDVIVRRWQDYTCEAAVHALTGLTFDERAGAAAAAADELSPR